MNNTKLCPDCGLTVNYKLGGYRDKEPVQLPCSCKKPHVTKGDVRLELGFTQDEIDAFDKLGVEDQS